MKTFATRIDIAEEKRGCLIRLLNQQLADTFDLRSQVKQAHWNVKGPTFIALHELFDQLAGELETYIDDVAERVTALGGSAQGTSRQAASHSRLPEYPADAVVGHEHVTALAERYAAVAQSTRAAIDACMDVGDAGTADLFTEIVRGLDKSLWFLEAHLQTGR
ncbi:MAG: DNA starvation/stationary phase protection protein Dps [Planctomycetes bacterium]|nr:DNA starvation/stationary phase protection protein Dps [Planctomycetota bacterium]